MRLEICAAATLLVGNVFVLDPADVTAPPPPIIAPPPITSRSEANPAEAARLAALWMANNAGYHAPSCAYHDPLAILDADVDPTPGREHVIGNRRHGVAMLSERGVLIARMDPIGCTGPVTDEDQSISVGYQAPRLVVRARTVFADRGEYFEHAHIVERSDDKLETLAILNLDAQVSGHVGEARFEARMYMQPDQILVKYHGRQRADGEPAWSGIDQHCTLSRRDGKFVPDDPHSMCVAPGTMP